MSMTIALFLERYAGVEIKLDLPRRNRPRHGFARAFERYAPQRLESQESILCARNSYLIGWDEPTVTASSHPFAYSGFRSQAHVRRPAVTAGCHCWHV
jgi:hypothetical protein